MSISKKKINNIIDYEIFDEIRNDASILNSEIKNVLKSIIVYIGDEIYIIKNNNHSNDTKSIINNLLSCFEEKIVKPDYQTKMNKIINDLNNFKRDCSNQILLTRIEQYSNSYEEYIERINSLFVSALILPYELYKISNNSDINNNHECDKLYDTFKNKLSKFNNDYKEEFLTFDN